MASSATSPTPTVQNPEFVVDQIFPAHEVHLIGGPSGASKTTFLFQLIGDWRSGRPILGYASFPAPFVYIACDRSLATTKRTLKRLGIAAMPILSIIDSEITPSPASVLAAARKLVPDLKVLFLDAIAALCPKINEYDNVAKFLRVLTRICQKEGITVIALGHATKVREGEKFLNPRQRFLGSVAWGGYSDTMILIEPNSPENPSDLSRTVMLLPRNAPSQALQYTLDANGRLIPIEQDMEDFLLDQWLKKIPTGTNIRTADVIAAAEAQSLSRSTVMRWIKKQVEIGLLKPVEKGHYRVTQPS